MVGCPQGPELSAEHRGPRFRAAAHTTMRRRLTYERVEHPAKLMRACETELGPAGLTSSKLRTGSGIDGVRRNRAQGCVVAAGAGLPASWATIDDICAAARGRAPG